MPGRGAELLRAACEIAGIAGWEFDANSQAFTWLASANGLLDAAVPQHSSLTDVLTHFPVYARGEIRRQLLNAVNQQSTFDMEIPFITRQKRTKWLRLAGAPPTDVAHGHRLIGALQDISAERSAAQTLRAAIAEAHRANKVKDMFLANMSHEIRTPLNGVIGMTDLLLQTDLEPAQREYVELARSSGETLLSLVSNVLDFAKIDSDNLELEVIQFDLRTTIDEAVGAVMHSVSQKSLDIEVEMTRQCRRAYWGDPTRLRQVLINLLGNAVKFTPEGAIKLSVHMAKQFDSLQTLEFAISDNGIGIPPDKLDLLFSPFTQTDPTHTRRYGGTGLGLSICRRIVEAMNGVITVESEVGAGSTFRFRVDLSLGAESSEPAAIAARAEKALFIGPESSVYRTLQADLYDLGITLSRTDEAFEAAQVATSKPRSNAPLYELIFIDINDSSLEKTASANLPYVQNKSAFTKLIGLCSLHEFTALSADRRFYTVLQKPLRRSSLLRTVMNALKVSQPTSLTVDTASYQGKSVLLAEDNPTNVKIQSKLIERLGINVMVARDGREALSILAKHRFDAVLMDCQMPELDGYDTTKAIRRGKYDVLDPQVPIIALTAYAMAEDRERCFSVGMDGYLNKPIGLEALEIALRPFLSVTSIPDPTSNSLANEHTPAPVGKASSPSEASLALHEAQSVIFDHQRALEVADGDAEFLTELLETYLKSISRLLSDLKSALDADDHDYIRRVAHQIKGASMNVGALRIGLMAEEIEKNQRSDRYDVLASTWSATSIEVNKAIAVAREKLMDWDPN